MKYLAIYETSTWKGVFVGLVIISKKKHLYWIENAQTSILLFGVAYK